MLYVVTARTVDKIEKATCRSATVQARCLRFAVRPFGTFLYLSLLCFFSSSVFAVPAVNPDKATLLQLKEEFLKAGGTLALPTFGQSIASGPMGEWQEDAGDPCGTPHWHAIGCTYFGRVSSLNLTLSLLEGPIPSVLGSLSYLTTLKLGSNELEGSIPDALSALTKLVELSIDNNKLNGSLPEFIGNLLRVKHLQLSNNQLRGSLPDSISRLSVLTLLDLSMNRLEGSIPDLTLSALHLQHLALSVNNFTGTVPDWLSGMALLKFLGLRQNNLEGPIPEFEGPLAFERLHLEKNHLTGSIPASLGNLTLLVSLFLGDNDLSGPIPDALSHLTNLELLDLGHNQKLGGTIPSSLSALTNLGLMQLTGCNFSGTLPNSLSVLGMLEELYLDGNRLSGSIPAAYGVGMSSLDQLFLGENELVGTIPRTLCSLSVLNGLNLADNRLRGPIPDCLLTSMRNLQSITLSNNFLTGKVPEAPSNATIYFQYDGNCLEGAADQRASCTPSASPAGMAPTPPPPTPSTLPAPAHIPNTAPPTPAAPPTRNPAPPPTQTPAPPPLTPPPVPVVPVNTNTPGSSPSSPHGLPLWVYVTLGSTLLLIFVIVAFSTWLPSPSTLNFTLLPTTFGGGGGVGGGGQPFGRNFDQLLVAEYSLSKIKRATRNFSTVFGHGSFGTVYLAEDFRKDEPGVADPRAIIKRASDPHKLGEFLFKCKVEVLARARHRFVVSLLGYCVGKGERVLVYEYLPNGTLFDRLHRPELEPLPWDTRVRIAVCVACALEHLHSVSPPLAHKAVTSSNILLTADMCAKLSDFGIARGGILSGSSASSVYGVGAAQMGPDESGAVAPELRAASRAGGRRTPRSSGAGGASGRPNGEGGGDAAQQLQLEKVDVYGYGVVLLELITGQKAMKEVHITSVAAPFLEDPQMIPLMVDPQLGGYFNQSEVVDLAGIARECVREDPMARPTMRDVLQTLEEKLRVDYASLIDPAADPDGGDPLTDGFYSDGRHRGGVGGGDGALTPRAAAWQTLEKFAASVRSVLLSPGSRGYAAAGTREGVEDLEMSSLLVMRGGTSSSADISTRRG